MEERPTLLIIDMVKDNLNESRPVPITPLARKLFDPINRLSALSETLHGLLSLPRTPLWLEDFIFGGKMKPHSLAGTTGAEVAEELDRHPEDLWLPKPRFSAFFRTGLEEWLKARRSHPLRGCRNHHQLLCAHHGHGRPLLRLQDRDP